MTEQRSIPFLDRLPDLFHTGAPSGDAPLAVARSFLADLAGGEAMKTAELLAAIDTHGFHWGVSDRN